ncbi:MAG: M1 family metallopeptidase [Candidatus Competibacteraceae bacterium]|nr:M1 family metallopeptidase [Candidatus Competibacteraceae bacterium]
MKQSFAFAIAGLLLLISGGVAGFSDAADHPKDLQIGDSVIELTFSSGHLNLTTTSLTQWITISAKAVADYYGAFPVPHLHLMITPVSGNRISGVSYAGEEPVLVIQVGESVNQAALQEDWVMVHEMVHLAFPPVHKRHHWIEEGLATYTRTLGTYNAGLLSVDKVWLWWVNGLPNGLPEAADRGLDHTPTWGRTYWGGALFCLLADMEIRRLTENRFALHDALKGIVAAGKNMATKTLSPLSEVLAHRRSGHRGNRINRSLRANERRSG